MENRTTNYSDKMDKYRLKIKKIASYRSGGAKSLDHQASEKYIKTLANPHTNIDMNKISVASYLIDTSFPPGNERQLDNISNRITGYFTKLYEIAEAERDDESSETEILPLFLLLGFAVNVEATNQHVFGRSVDKHAIVFSLLKIKSSYRLEIFDANGAFVPEEYPFDRALLEVATRVATYISNSYWFITMNDGKPKKIQVRQFMNPKLNFGAGHCDLLAISYIEGRNRYHQDDRVLLEKLTRFSVYPDKQKEELVRKVNKSIQQNVSIIRKMVPESFKFPL